MGLFFVLLFLASGPGTVAKMAEGEIEFALPQLADMVQPFRSQIRELLRGRTELERLAIEMYARGFSVRDIETAFSDEGGAAC